MFLDQSSIKRIYLCPNLWIVAMATEMLNLQKKNKKIISSEAIRGIKLKVCRSVNNISLYKNDVFIAFVEALWLL